jgi:hypothetical protein
MLERDLDPEFRRFLLEPRNLHSLQTLLLFHVLPARVHTTAALASPTARSPVMPCTTWLEVDPSTKKTHAPPHLAWPLPEGFAGTGSMAHVGGGAFPLGGGGLGLSGVGRQLRP